MMKFEFGTVCVLLAWFATTAVAQEQRPSPPSPADRTGIEFFETEIRPVLVRRCYECHGPESEHEAGLRVDSLAALIEGGDTGPAIVPGKPKESLLIDAISYGEVYEMPPDGKLSMEEIAALTKWVKIGAPWPNAKVPLRASKREDQQHEYTAEEESFWAFQEVVRPEVPVVLDSSWPRTDIDNFVLAQLEASNLRPAPAADKRTLIRRATYDLHGLPPTPAEIDELLREMGQSHLNQHGPSSELEARIKSFELAFHMQTEAPAVQDISDETKATLELYGINESRTEDFGRQCLLARRFVEKGVRFVQCNLGGWDHHYDLSTGLPKLTGNTDKPIAGLLKDLRSRGLLKDTLVVWGGEFGRTPMAEGSDGRDHNPYGYTMWLAGGGVKAGLTYGRTDEFGFRAIENKMHVHDMQATILHLLGLDHQRLSVKYAGLDVRLTGVTPARVAHDIVA